MDYLLKANGLIILFYVFFHLFLRNETFFKSIRIYFLVGLVLIISIPLIVIPIYVQKANINVSWQTFEGAVNNTSAIPSFNWTQLIMLIYFAGVLFFSVKLCLELFSLKRIISNNKIIKQGKHLLVETSVNVTPFSFFNYIIYYKGEFTSSELENIITHEKAHVKQWHSIDTILCYFLQISFWFNPFAWLYKNKVGQNLEFIADQIVISNSTSKKSYQELLLKTSLPKIQLGLTNNFYNSLLKKRIMMLHSKKSNNKAHWKFALLFPLITLFLFTFCTTTVAQKKKDIQIRTISDSYIYEMILTKESSKEDLNLLINNFNKKGVNVSVKEVKRNGKNKITSIKIGAKVKGGKTSHSYATNDDDGIKDIQVSFNSRTNNLIIGSSTATNNNQPEPIYIFNGREITKEMLENIVPETIDSISVLKDNNATGKYGEKGKNGVVEIKSKPIYKVKINFDDKKSLTILNGKEISQKELKNLNPDSIDRIDVFKGEKAIEKYGEKGKNGVVEIKTKAGNRSKISLDDKKPLTILDGKEISQKEFKNLNLDTIDKIDVLKGEKAIEKYGEKGSNGVIKITTKKE